MGAGRPHRHPLHRGRRLDPALRRGPRARHGDGRLPHAVAQAARQKLAEQARIMVDAGAQCVYVVGFRRGGRALGCAGAHPGGHRRDRARRRSGRFPWAPEPQPRHRQLVLAYQAGAKQIDGALCALGAGAGNSPTEVLAATFERLGIRTGVDLGEVLSAAEDVAPVHPAAAVDGSRVDHPGLRRGLFVLPSPRRASIRAVLACRRTRSSSAWANSATSVARRT